MTLIYYCYFITYQIYKASITYHLYNQPNPETICQSLGLFCVHGELINAYYQIHSNHRRVAKRANEFGGVKTRSTDHRIRYI